MHVRLVSVVLMLVGLVGIAFAERAPIQERRHKRPNNTPVRHDTAFKSVPGTKLQIRAIVYDGSTNGTLTVQVKNAAKSAQKFSATGLYFVPEGDPDTAPQRLGAVGPMQIASDEKRKELSEVEIAAGATVELQLDVFCIDSHRPSPSPQNRFNVGTSKLPKDLATQIERRADWETDANDVDFHIQDAQGGHAFYSSPELPSGGELYADITDGYGPECFTIEGRPKAGPYKISINYYSQGPMGYGMGLLQIVKHDGKGKLEFQDRPYVIMNDHAYVNLGSFR